MSCLLDTGSMVSTITESFFLQNFEPWGHEKLKSCHWLQLRAANGLDIPYVGLLEFNIEIFGKVIPILGVLVIKDLPSNAQKHVAPGALGMNVIQECYNELFGQHGPALLDFAPVNQAPNSWQQAYSGATRHKPNPPQAIPAV